MCIECIPTYIQSTLPKLDPLGQKKMLRPRKNLTYVGLKQ